MTLNKLVKTYIASGAIAHRRQVKLGAADGVVIQAAAATDAIIGVTDHPGGVADGERVDVVLLGITDLEFGGTIARGAFVTSDASGRGVAAAPATGINNSVSARAHVSAVSGDIVPVLVIPGQIQGA